MSSEREILLAARIKNLEAALQAIIDGCVHPETAKRRVMVDLAPIRKILKEKIDIS
jgi:hypothetical protein